MYICISISQIDPQHVMAQLERGAGYSEGLGQVGTLTTNMLTLSILWN